MRGLVFFTVVSMIGCKDKEPVKVSVAPPVVEQKTPADIAFIIAKPEITNARIPERFANAIPHTRAVADKKDGSFPPYPFIEASIEANTNGMRDRLLASVRLAAASGSVAEDMAIWYPRLIGYSPSTELCAWIVGVATGKEPAAVRGVFWGLTEQCRDPAITVQMTGDEVPDEVVLEAYSAGNGTFAFNPRVASAAARMAKSKIEHQVELVGYAFSSMGGPETMAAFLALQKSLPADRAARIAIGLVYSEDSAMRDLAKKACAHPAVAKDRVCTEEVVRTKSRGLKWGEIAETRKEDLESCARTRESRYEAAQCLQKLAGVDRAAAVAIAKTITEKKDDYYAALASNLLKYPEADAIPKYLASVGITPTVNARKDALTSIEQALAVYGRVDRFDTETSTYPNNHDELLARLAQLGSPALDGVVFEEIAPGLDNDSAPYTLVAYLDRKRFAVTAENNGDWYDMDAVVGLLNALVVDRRSPTRFVVLPTGDQTATVLAGPSRALGLLVADGAIKVADANAAMKAGKDFENQVIDRLQQGN